MTTIKMGEHEVTIKANPNETQDDPTSLPVPPSSNYARDEMTGLPISEPEAEATLGDLLSQARRLGATYTDMQSQLAEIRAWWVSRAEADANVTLPKALEYGAADFDVMGPALLALGGATWEGADPGEKRQAAQEMAIMFYLLGKVGRAISAYQQGNLPSDDTLFDLRVYAMMACRVRETGRWVD